MKSFVYFSIFLKCSVFIAINNTNLVRKIVEQTHRQFLYKALAHQFFRSIAFISRDINGGKIAALHKYKLLTERMPTYFVCELKRN